MKRKRKASKPISLKELNRQLKLPRAEVLRRVAANCKRLTGKEVL